MKLKADTTKDLQLAADLKYFAIPEAEKRLEELLAEIERQKQAANNYTYDQSTTKKINIPKRSINQLK